MPFSNVLQVKGFLILSCVMHYTKLRENLQHLSPCLIMLLKFYEIFNFNLILSWTCTLELSLDYIMRQQYKLYFHHCLLFTSHTCYRIYSGQLNKHFSWCDPSSHLINYFEKNLCMHSS